MSRRENKNKQMYRAEKILSLLCGEQVGLRSKVIFDEIDIPQPSGAKLLNKMAAAGILRRGDVVDTPGNAKSYFWVPALDVGLGGDDVPFMYPSDDEYPNVGRRVLHVSNPTNETKVVRIVERHSDEVSADKVRELIGKLSAYGQKFADLTEKLDYLHEEMLDALLGE